MIARKVDVVVLCEDRQHESFIRRFLKGAGWSDRRIRAFPASKGRGSGEQHVRSEFVKQLSSIRKRRGVALFVMIDGDQKGFDKRLRDFELACQDGNIDFRGENDAVVIAIPCSRIETWIAFLEGQAVDESTEFRKLTYESECQKAVDALLAACAGRGFPRPPPPSLAAVCDEYLTLKSLLETR